MKKCPIFKPKASNAPKFNPRINRDRLYDDVWKKYKIIFLNVNKHCYACGKHAQVVDHIIAHKGKENLFSDVKNHMPLCHQCHNFITAKFDHEEIPKIKEKIEWIENMRKQNSLSSSIKILPRYGAIKK